MTKVFVLILLVSEVVIASESLLIKNFSFQYEFPKGSGTATDWILPFLPVIPQDRDLGAQNITMEFVENPGAHEIWVYSDLATHLWKNAPDYLLKVKDFSTTQFNLYESEQSYNLNFKNFVVHRDESSITASDATAICNVIDTTEDLPMYEKIMLGCLNHGSIFIKQLDTVFKRCESKLSILGIIANAAIKPWGDSTSASQVSSFDFKNNQHKFELKMRIKGFFSGTVKLTGMIDYLIPTGEVKMSVDQATFGLLSFKNKLYKAIEESECSTMRVERPYIYLDLF